MATVGPMALEIIASRKKVAMVRLVAKNKKKGEEDEKIRNIIERHDANLEYWKRLRAEDIGKPIDEGYIKKMRENGITFDAINNIVRNERCFDRKTWINNVLKNPYNFALCCPHKLTFPRCEKIRNYENLDIPNKVRSFTFLKFQLISGCNGEKGWVDDAKMFVPYWKIKRSYEKWCKNAPMTPVYKQIDDLSYYCFINGMKQVTSVYFYNMERNIESFLEDLIIPDRYLTSIGNEDIEKIPQPAGTKLNIEQVQACVNALTKPISIIHGPGGTGKSTIIRTIVKSTTKGKVVLCAPTGLAAQGLTNKTWHKAYTLHKYFWTKKLFYAQHPELNPKNKNRCALPTSIMLIIDEMSMVDVPLLDIVINCLKDFVKRDIPLQIVFVGDPEQLPPIGVGRPFCDFLQRAKFPKTKLTKIMRQKDKKLLNSINKIRNYDIADEHDDFIVHNCKANEIEEELKGVINKHKYEIGKDCQVLTAQKKYLGGTHELNSFLQKLLNPNGLEITCNNHECFEKEWCSVCGRQTKYKFRQGDRILQKTNDYTKEIYKDAGFGESVHLLRPCFTCNQYNHCALECPKAKKAEEKDGANGVKNGMLGYISQIIKRDSTKQYLLIIKFADLKADWYVRYALKEANNNLIPAFCLTVDKYQGCEKDNIITIMSRLHTRWDKGVGHQLLYTAVSRAKKKCHIIGDKTLLLQVSKKHKGQTEITSLFQNRIFLDIDDVKNHTCLDEYDYLLDNDEEEDDGGDDEHGKAMRELGYRKCETCKEWEIEKHEPLWKTECTPCYISGARQCEDCLKYNIKRYRPIFETRCYKCYKKFKFGEGEQGEQIETKKKTLKKRRWIKGKEMF